VEADVPKRKRGRPRKNPLPPAPPEESFAAQAALQQPGPEQQLEQQQSGEQRGALRAQQAQQQQALPQQPLPRQQAAPGLDAELTGSLANAPSIREAALLLLEHREAVTVDHLAAAVRRMGFLQRAARRPPAPEDQEAFGGVLQLLLDMAAQQGRALSGVECVSTLRAAGWLGVPPTPAQQATMEAAVMADGTLAAEQLPDDRGMQEQQQEEFLSAAYVRLGLRPGPQLAAALAPPPSQARGCRCSRERCCCVSSVAHFLYV
jgi:hypothetical protein